MTSAHWTCQRRSSQLAVVKVLLGTHKGILPGNVTDDDRGDHAVRLPCVIVPDLGRDDFSSANASRRGIKTTVVDGHHGVTKGGAPLSPQQLSERLGLCSLAINLLAISYGTNSIAMATQQNANVWYRRLGLMNPDNMRLSAKLTTSGSTIRGTSLPVIFIM